MINRWRTQEHITHAWIPFSLKGKYRNTHFALNEEQMGVSPTPPPTYHQHLSTHGEVRTHLSKWENERGESLGCVSILTPPPSIYRSGSLRENTPRTTGMPLVFNGETTRGRWRRTALRWGRPTWAHHVLRCAFSQWLICGPIWRFQVPTWFGGG
jgi:hypothetical protein